MKTILITGASGFLGKRIAAACNGKYRILAPSHRQMDILSPEAVRACVQQEKPDYIIHCAAMSDPSQCEQEPSLSWDVNVEGCTNVARAAGSAKYILCSCDQVYYSCKSPESHGEEELLHPFPIYGVEKLQAEQDCLEFNPHCVVLRLSRMYDPQAADRRDFFHTLLHSIKSSTALSLPVFDKRGFTDVNEVTNRIEAVLELPGGVYNFGSPNDLDSYHLAEQVVRKLGLNTGCLVQNTEAFHRQHRNLSMNPEKLSRFGISFPTTEESLLRNLQRCL